jgi:hypothetical protein
MAVRAKVVFFFNQDRWGWTETYYLNILQGYLSEALSMAKTLADVRVPMLSKSCVFEAIRVSDLDNPRSSILSYYRNPNITPNTLSEQEPWEAGLVDLTASQTIPFPYRFSRKLMLRGLPLAWNNWSSADPLAPPINPLFNSVFLNFIGVLTNAGGTISLWSMLVLDRTPTVNKRVPITAVATQSQGGYFQVTTDNSSPFFLGQKIHVYGASGPGTLGLNGDGVIIAVGAAGTYTISRKQACSSATVQLLTATTMASKFKFLIPISEGQFDRFVKRDTGRAFFGTRGRQSGVRC